MQNFPQRGRGLGHVTPKIFGIQSNLSSKLGLLELETSNLVHSFLLEKSSGRSNKFPQKGRGLGHVTPKFFGIQSNLSSKLLELETLNLVHSFHLEKPSGRANNFPQKGHGLGHVTGKNLWQTIPNILKIIRATDFKFGQ